MLIPRISATPVKKTVECNLKEKQKNKAVTRGNNFRFRPTCIS